MKYLTQQFAVWNIGIFMSGILLGAVIGLNEQFLNLVRNGFSFCGRSL